MVKILKTDPVNEDDLQGLYEWVDEIPLSRPKRNIARDFSDGVMMAEVLKHYYPNLVELHNYPKAHSMKQKQTNWNTLNEKVLNKLGYQVKDQDIQSVISCEPGALESVLKKVKEVVIEKKRQVSPSKSTPSKEGLKLNISASEDRPLSGLELKERTIEELKETIEILEEKVQKLEKNVKFKDAKLEKLRREAEEYGIDLE